jgi:hypothetical protein
MYLFAISVDAFHGKCGNEKIFMFQGATSGMYGGRKHIVFPMRGGRKQNVV